jgi:hypothetical protein
MLDLDAIFDPDRPLNPPNPRLNARPCGEQIREPPGTPAIGDGDCRRSQPLDAVLPIQKKQTLEPYRRDWDSETHKLIGFFQSARPRLPRTPFRLTRWRYISDPAKWYRSLELDISFGPLGCRARMGALQEDLRRLRGYLSSGDGD